MIYTKVYLDSLPIGTIVADEPDFSCPGWAECNGQEIPEDSPVLQLMGEAYRKNRVPDTRVSINGRYSASSHWIKIK